MLDPLLSLTETLGSFKRARQLRHLPAKGISVRGLQRRPSSKRAIRSRRSERSVNPFVSKREATLAIWISGFIFIYVYYLSKSKWESPILLVWGPSSSNLVKPRSQTPYL